jgi:hypothetical protein
VVEHSIDAMEWLRKQLEEEHPDVVRAMVQSFAEQLMSAEADARAGVGHAGGYDQAWDPEAARG